MTDRSRAWRRRQARLTFWKSTEQKQVFAAQFHDPEAKPHPALKQHQHGKLTHAQDLKLVTNLGQQLAEGFDAV